MNALGMVLKEVILDNRWMKVDGWWWVFGAESKEGRRGRIVVIFGVGLMIPSLFSLELNQKPLQFLTISLKLSRLSMILDEFRECF